MSVCVYLYSTCVHEIETEMQRYCYLLLQTIKTLQIFNEAPPFRPPEHIHTLTATKLSFNTVLSYHLELCPKTHSLEWTNLRPFISSISCAVDIN